MFKTPKVLLAMAAALGLAGAPTVTLTNNAPLSQAPADPAAKTDARSTRYYVPKGMQSKKSRLTRLCEKVFDSRLPNRFLRRSVARAAMQGRGRAGEIRRAAIYGYARGTRDGVPLWQPTTRRAVESLKRLQGYAEMLRARDVAARVLASPDVQA